MKSNVLLLHYLFSRELGFLVCLYHFFFFFKCKSANAKGNANSCSRWHSSNKPFNCAAILGFQKNWT